MSLSSGIRLDDPAALRHRTERAIDAARRWQQNILFSTGTPEELSQNRQALVGHKDERLQLSQAVDRREEGADYGRLVTLEKDLRAVRERLQKSGISFTLDEKQTNVRWVTTDIPETLHQSTGIESIRYEIICSANKQGAANLFATASSKAGKYHFMADVSSEDTLSTYAMRMIGPAPDKQSEVVYANVFAGDSMETCDGSSTRAIRKGGAVMTTDPALDDKNVISPGLEQFFRHASGELGLIGSDGDPYLTPFLR